MNGARVRVASLFSTPTSHALEAECPSDTMNIRTRVLSWIIEGTIASAGLEEEAEEQAKRKGAGEESASASGSEEDSALGSLCWRGGR
jgi:hypothetical protein